MIRLRKHPLLTVLVVVLLFVAAACSSTGGKKAQQNNAIGSSGKANTPAMKFAMITHAPAGDTFFDIIRKGADAAAAKDNVTYTYSNDSDPSRQATLIQNAIDSKPDGIAVSVPNLGALTAPIKKAVAAGIPVVMFNAGIDGWQQAGALMYFGQDESLAGQAAGQKLIQDGAKHVVCIPQEQGQVQLEARCAGVKKGFSGTTDKLYVTGTNMPSVRSTIAAKLKQDPSIDHVITLGAPFALAAVQSVKDAGSKAKVVTFDMNPALVQALKAGDVQWAIDQQPFVQGYESIDSLWLYKTNGDIIGGGKPVLTGPAIVTKDTVSQIESYAARGTR